MEKVSKNLRYLMKKSFSFCLTFSIAAATHSLHPNGVVLWQLEITHLSEKCTQKYKVKCLFIY